MSLLRTFNADFDRQVRRTPDGVVAVDARTERFWTYAELDRITRRLVAFLASRGSGSGRPIVSLLPNGMEQLFMFVAALRGGLGFAPLSPQVTLTERVRFAQMVGAVGCLVPQYAEASVYAGLKGAGVQPISIVTDGQFEWLEDSVGHQDQYSGLGQRPSSLYIATSGTTADPKMLVINGDTLWSSAVAFTQTHRFLDASARFYNVLPMSYLGGLFNLGLIPLASGGSVVVSDAFSGASLLTFWSEAERFEVNVLWLTPTMARGFLAIRRRVVSAGEPTLMGPRIRAVLLGMAPIDLATKRLFEQEFGVPLIENYGISETTFLATETLESQSHRVEGSVGQILPYVQLRFAERTDGEESASLYREIEVRSPFCCEGYLLPGGREALPMTEDGWFRTGDLGRMDEGGLLVLRGRLRDIIKKGGYLVSLRELECLAELHPLVAEAVAVGIPHEFYGEDAVLFIRLTRHAIAEEGSAKQQLAQFRSWLTSELPRFKWPARVIVVEEFPRTSTGKAKKHALARQLDGKETFLNAPTIAS